MHLQQRGNRCEIVDLDALVTQYIVGYIASLWYFGQVLLAVRNGIADIERNGDAGVSRKRFHNARAQEVWVIIVGVIVGNNSHTLFSSP